MSEKKYDIRIAEEKYNPLIGRKELNIVISHVGAGTPQRYYIREQIAKILSVPIESVYVISVRTRYGQGLSYARVHVYDDPKRGEEIEDEYIKRRNMPPSKKEGGESE